MLNFRGVHAGFKDLFFRNFDLRRFPIWLAHIFHSSATSHDLGPLKGSFLEGTSLATSGKSRLVKYHTLAKLVTVFVFSGIFWYPFLWHPRHEHKPWTLVNLEILSSIFERNSTSSDPKNTIGWDTPALLVMAEQRIWWERAGTSPNIIAELIWQGPKVCLVTRKKHLH